VPKKRTRKASSKVTPIGEVRTRVLRIREDVEEVVDNIRKRAIRALPPSQRKQVDGVIDRISAVGQDVNKTVDGLRADIEKQYRLIRGTVDKRVGKISKRTRTRGKKLVTGIESDVRKYVDGIFRRLQLPVHGDLETIKRRLTSIERRLASLERSESRAA
jgi:hypothetical protein